MQRQLRQGCLIRLMQPIPCLLSNRCAENPVPSAKRFGYPHGVIRVRETIPCWSESEIGKPKCRNGCGGRRRYSTALAARGEYTSSAGCGGGRTPMRIQSRIGKADLSTKYIAGQTERPLFCRHRKHFRLPEILFLPQKLLARQQEHEAVAAAGFQPHKRQLGIGGFQHVAVVSDFHQQHAAWV